MTWISAAGARNPTDTRATIVPTTVRERGGCVSTEMSVGPALWSREALEPSFVVAIGPSSMRCLDTW